MGRLRIGTAGWAIPRDIASAFPGEGTQLERYAARFEAAEINSTFHRPHRSGTFARWRDSVPAGFRFSVKLPKAVTHQQRLVDCSDALTRFAEQIETLGDRRGPILIQLPPSLAFDATVAAGFFAQARSTLGGPFACEPRHASWFSSEANDLLRGAKVARVAADPARVPEAAEPGGWRSLVYIRLHGSPRTYWSAYDESVLLGWAERLRRFARDADETWIIFDNTAGGAAAADALAMGRIMPS